MLNIFFILLVLAIIFIFYALYSAAKEREAKHYLKSDINEIKLYLDKERKNIADSLKPFDEQIARMKILCDQLKEEIKLSCDKGEGVRKELSADKERLENAVKGIKGLEGARDDVREKFEAMRRELFLEIKAVSRTKASGNIDGQVVETRKSAAHIYRHLKAMLEENARELKQLRLQASGHVALARPDYSQLAEKLDENLKDIRGGKKQRIGEILVSKGFITVNMLNEAIDCQLRYGGGITQYLVAFGYVSEDDLAKCVSEQFKVPYLSATSFSVPQAVIDMIPVDVVRKYCLIPVDHKGDTLNVIMADPLDANAIKKIQEVTNCKVCPYIGLISEIMEAMEAYYHITAESGKVLLGNAAAVVKTDNYVGLEHRKAMRFNAALDIDISMAGKNIKARTIDISATGLLLYFEHTLDVGEYIDLSINFPAKLDTPSIIATVRVVRIRAMGPDKFAIGMNFAKIGKNDLERLMRYVRNLQKGRESFE